MIKPNLDHTPTDTELKDNAQELAWLALGFFQALLKGDAKIVIDQHGYPAGKSFERITISLDWSEKTQEETV